MVRKICLDSDVIIALLNKEATPQQALESSDAILCITAINAFEIWYGRKNEETVHELLAWLEIIPINDTVVRLAADILRDLKKQGAILDFKDLFIAAACIVNDLELLTYNQKHFVRLKKYGLKLVE
ncbi:MAG: type II toxin-antitoxin system VapC family toxin [Nanoarchaeota archaeon]